MLHNKMIHILTMNIISIRVNKLAYMYVIMNKLNMHKNHTTYNNSTLSVEVRLQAYTLAHNFNLKLTETPSSL